MLRSSATHSILAQPEEISVYFNFTFSSLYPGVTLVCRVVLQFQSQWVLWPTEKLWVLIRVLFNDGMENGYVAPAESGSTGFNMDKCVSLGWSIKRNLSR